MPQSEIVTVWISIKTYVERDSEKIEKWLLRHGGKYKYTEFLDGQFIAFDFDNPATAIEFKLTFG